jgi:hypothetical protein
MRNLLYRSATSIVVLLGVLLGTSGCAAENNGASARFVEPPAAVEATPTMDGAKAFLAKLFAQVRSDSAAYKPKAAGLGDSAADNEAKKAVFKEAYKASFALVDPSMNEKEAQDFITTYSAIFIMDPKSKVLTDEAEINLSRDTATVLGTNLSWVVFGLALPKAADDDKTHTISLKAHGNDWLISGYTLTHK